MHHNFYDASYSVSTVCRFPFSSITPSLEPVVVLCGQDVAATAILLAMYGKQADKDPTFPHIARRLVPVALVGWLMGRKTINCMYVSLPAFCYVRARKTDEVNY